MKKLLPFLVGALLVLCPIVAVAQSVTITGAYGAIAADNLLGNPTGSSAAPIATPLVSCTGTNKALTYDPSTHTFGCNTISGGGGGISTLTAGTNITLSSGSTCTTTCTISASGGGGSSTPPYLSSGYQNVFRNASLWRWDHYWFRCEGTQNQNCSGNLEPINFSAFTASLAPLSPAVSGYSLLTVTAKASGTIQAWQQIAGSGLTGGLSIAGDALTNADCGGGTLCTGNGGTGTYLVLSTVAQTVSSQSMTSTGTWTAEGAYATATGAPAQYAPDCDGGGWFFGDQCSIDLVGAASNTDVSIRLPIESTFAGKLTCNTDFHVGCYGLGSNTVTLTMYVIPQGSAFSAFTPTLTTKAPCNDATSCGLVGIDDWKTPVTDLSPVNLQTCSTFNAICTLSYTFDVNDGAVRGYEAIIDFGALVANQDVIVVGYDIRRTPSATCSGTASPCLQAGPPIPELANPAIENVVEQRYTNLISPGAQYTNNQQPFFPAAIWNSSTAFISLPFANTLRCGPLTGDNTYGANCPVPTLGYAWDQGAAFSPNGYLELLLAGGTPAISAVAAQTNSQFGLTLAATVSGQTPGLSGWAKLTNNSMIMIDSSVYGAL